MSARAMERAEVQFGNTRLHYGVVRSPRRGTVSIIVSPQQGVVLKAPRGVPEERLARVVRQKAPWILRKLREQGDLGPVARREFVSGESFLYLGRQYRLRAQGRSQEAKLKDGWLQVGVADGRRALVGWYRGHARDRLEERVALWAKRMGLEITPRVHLREQAKRWASCDRHGNLRFNWRIIQAPLRLVDYVVVHELVHLRHRNHDAAYWREVGRLMPDYEERRQALRRRGPELEW